MLILLIYAGLFLLLRFLTKNPKSGSDGWGPLKLIPFRVAVVLLTIVAVVVITLKVLLPVEPSNLVVDDIITDDYPLRVDFRFRNPSSKKITVSKILFKIVDFKTGPSPIGGQEISEHAQMKFRSTDRMMDTLMVPVSFFLEPDETYRLVVNISWFGPPPSIGHHYTLVPAIKTSNGYIRCKPIWINLKEDSRSNLALNQRGISMPPFLMGADEASAIEINWKDEEALAKDARRGE